MVGVLLCGGSERTLCVSIKMKPRLCWRPQDVEDARVVRYMPRRVANRVWNHMRERISVNKAERSWGSEEHFDIRDEDAEFGVCSDCFGSCFGPVFLLAPFPPLWNANIYPVPLYFGSM